MAISVTCGDIVKLKTKPGEYLVLSCSDFSHFSGRVWLCPIVAGLDDFPLHIKIHSETEKSILCERLLDDEIGNVEKVLSSLPTYQWNEVKKIILAILGGSDEI